MSHTNERCGESSLQVIWLYMAQKPLRISLSSSIISLSYSLTLTDSSLFRPFFFPLCSKLPSWAKAFVPRFFYVTEKAWNFYPYTITGGCLQKLKVQILCQVSVPYLSIYFSDNVFTFTPLTLTQYLYFMVLTFLEQASYFCCNAFEGQMWQNETTSKSQWAENVC